jgi:hypothetical protein
VAGFPAPVPFLADTDLSYTDSNGEPVVICHPVSVIAAAHEIWQVARAISTYLEWIAG